MMGVLTMQNFMRFVHFSPLAFAAPGLESAFRRQSQRYRGLVTSFHMHTTLIFIAILVYRTLVKHPGHEHALVVGISLAASASISIVSLGLRHWAPLVFEKYQEALATASRISVTIHGITTRRIMTEDRGAEPFSTSIFGRMYMHNSLVVLLFLVSMGCPMEFVPNIITSVAMVFMVVADNPWYCTVLHEAPASGEDMRLMAPITSRVSTWTSVALAAGQNAQTPLPPIPCHANLALLQVASLTLSLLLMLLHELYSRRTFLIKHHAVLGPHGAHMAAAWPLGSGRGIIMCMGTAVGFLWGFSFIWQAILTVAQVQSEACAAENPGLVWAAAPA